jgi:hypothetical protein
MATATTVYAVKRRSDGAWYGPTWGKSFGFGGLRVSMFDTPGKAKTCISRKSGYGGVKPEDFAIMVIDLNQATEYVPN